MGKLTEKSKKKERKNELKELQLLTSVFVLFLAVRVIYIYIANVRSDVI